MLMLVQEGLMGFTRLATWEILDVSHQLKQRPIQTATALCVKWLFHDWGERNWQAPINWRTDA